jgi:alpha-beta hydrolase superfamily lysophospholipase
MQEKITFESDGLKLSGVIHIPAGYDGTPLPAFIVCHGFVGSKDESHAQIQAEMMENFGYVALRFDFRGCGESEGERAQVRCMDQVADAKNALTWLAKRPEVDGTRIGITGHSFGAAVSVYTAGVDERVACCLSSCGWGNGERKFRGQHPTPEAWARFTNLLEQGRAHKKATGESMWISRFDAVPIPEALRKNLSPKAIMEIPVETAWSMMHFRADDVVANIAPRPLLLLHTAHDTITPTIESVRMFEKAGQPTELILIDTTAHFPLAPNDAPRTKAIMKGWLDKFFPSPLSA